MQYPYQQGDPNYDGADAFEANQEDIAREDEMNNRIVPCTHCGSEGRIIRRCIGYEPGCGHAHMWGERDDGECPVCEGTGGEIIETRPIALEDLT